MHWPSFAMGSHVGSLWCPDRCQNHKMACLPEGQSGHKHLGERRFHTTWSRLAARKNTVLNWDFPAAISISTVLKPSPWSLSTVTTAISNNLARQTVQNGCPCRKARQPVAWPARMTPSGAVMLPAQPLVPPRWKSSGFTGPWHVNVPETPSQQQFHSVSASQWSVPYCTQISGIQVLWSSNTELIKWGVCLTCGFKNLTSSTRVWLTCYWLQSAGWLAEFCHGFPGWAQTAPRNFNSYSLQHIRKVIFDWSCKVE